MVQFSFRPPNADYLGFRATPEGIIESACKAEVLGFDAIVVNDHVIVDGSPRSASWANTYDPLIVLSYLAAKTSQIRLGTSVIIVPEEHSLTPRESSMLFPRESRSAYRLNRAPPG